MIQNDNVQAICKCLSDKKAEDIKIVDIKGMTDIADYFVVCSGRSMSQVKALYDYLDETMEKNGVTAIRCEGVREGRWIAVDYGEVIVHIFYKDARDVYALDVLWNNGTNVEKYQD